MCTQITSDDQARLMNRIAIAVLFSLESNRTEINLATLFRHFTSSRLDGSGSYRLLACEEETARELQKSWKIKAKHTRAHKAHSLVYREILKAYLNAHAFPCIYIQYSIFSTAVGEDPNDAFEQRRENPNVSGHAENPVFRG